MAIIGFDFFAHVDAQPVDTIASNSVHVVGLEVQVLPHPVSKPAQHNAGVVPVALAPLFSIPVVPVAQSTFSASTVLPSHMPVTVEGVVLPGYSGQSARKYSVPAFVFISIHSPRGCEVLPGMSTFGSPTQSFLEYISIITVVLEHTIFPDANSFVVVGGLLSLKHVYGYVGILCNGVPVVIVKHKI